MKKSICLIVVIFLLSLSFYGIVADESTLQKTISVDDDNTEGRWDGSAEYPYQTIRDGVNASSDGDTVFVYSGTYYENLVIDTSITIQGQDRNSTLSNGSGHEDVICVIADDVNISRFTIEYCGRNYMEDAGIDVQSSKNNVIQNCDILNNSNGIILNKANKNMIGYNTLEKCDFSILIFRSHNNMINGNHISGKHDVGIYSIGSYGNSICKNKLIGYHFSYAASCNGIWICGGFNNEIYRNNITGHDGGWGSSGIQLEGTHHNTIKENNFISNDDDAFYWNCFFTSWSHNYWDDLQTPVKIIFGQIQIVLLPFRIPCIDIDWFPAKEPYDISMGV